MSSVVDWQAQCPYCGESITLLIDPANIGMTYIEDCSVCCRPISVIVYGAYEGGDQCSIDVVDLRTENE